MIKKVSHIILSFVLIATTAGITINLHYCAGDLYSIGLDSKADNCSENEDHKGHMNKMNHNKCDDESINLKISDDFTKTVQKINIHNDFVIILFNTLFQDVINFFASNNIETDFYNFINSPPATRHILSLFQSYLL